MPARVRMGPINARGPREMVNDVLATIIATGPSPDIGEFSPELLPSASDRASILMNGKRG